MTKQSKSKAGQKPAGAKVEAIAETTVEAYEQAVETTKAQVEKAVETSKAQVEKANEAAVKGYDEFTAMQKDGVDALIKASAIWAKSAEDLGKAYLALAQEAAAANSEAAMALLSVKSFKEAVELQSEIARKSFDKSLSESVKLSEMSLKVANDVFQPIQQQFTAAIEKVGKIPA